MLVVRVNTIDFAGKLTSQLITMTMGPDSSKMVILPDTWLVVS